VIVVVDASNLQRNLYFATQVIELGYPTLIALNMVDVAEENGQRIDVKALSDELGVPVFPLVASKGTGIPELRKRILAGPHEEPVPKSFTGLPGNFATEIDRLSASLAQIFPETNYQAEAEAALILSDERFSTSSAQHYPTRIRDEVRQARERLDKAGIDWRSAAIEARYACLAGIQRAVTTDAAIEGDTISDRLDRVLTHKVWGLLIFLLIMTAMFQSIFSFAELPMKGLEKGVDWFGGLVGGIIPPGAFQSLLVDGVIGGVGGVLVFLTGILIGSS